MADLTFFGSYKIDTSADADQDGICGIAHCPICGQKEESRDHGQGKNYAVSVSVSKVRAHLIIYHAIDEPKNVEENDGNYPATNVNDIPNGKSKFK